MSDLRTLLDKAREQIDLMDENGNTALLIAARLGLKHCVALLLQSGADALHINRMGECDIIDYNQ